MDTDTGDGPETTSTAGLAPDPARRLGKVREIADSALGYMSLEEMLSELLERIRDGP